MFLHTVLTGLQNDCVQSDLQPCLSNPTVPDEVLSDKRNIACSNESERQNKRKYEKSRAVHAEQQVIRVLTTPQPLLGIGSSGLTCRKTLRTMSWELAPASNNNNNNNNKSHAVRKEHLLKLSKWPTHSNWCINFLHLDKWGVMSTVWLS